MSTDRTGTATVSRGALLRYRVLAWVVGVMLLVLLLVAVPLKRLGDSPGLVQTIGPMHGFLYMVYLLVAIDLAVKARWSPGGTLLVLLAGTVPFVSFLAERVVTRRVRAGVRL